MSVTSVTADRTDYHYDLYVPGQENYVAGGAVHHNSGKTELMRAVLVALVLGSDHPDAAAFWRNNGCNPEAFPTGPGRGWIIALDSNASLKYHRQQILSLLPKWGPRHPMSEGEGKPWHAWGLMAKGEARIEIMVPGYDTPASIWFKSDEPGADAMQGDSCRAILHDEESRVHGRQTWDEAAVRLWDQEGWHLMSNTPIRGRTWLYHDHVRQQREGEALLWIHAIDNPHLPARKRRELERLRETDPEQYRIRVCGDFVALEGRVWPQFARHSHVVPRFPIPEGSPRFRTIDFGTRHPFCCLWSVLLRSAVTLPDRRRIPDGALVVYREHYRREWTLAQHVAHIRSVEGPGERIAVTWVDPEDPQQMLQLAHTHGIEIVRANKAREAGLGCVAEWLSPQADGLPGLYIVDECVETIREVESYSYDGKGEVPKNQDDHACDGLRYLCMGVRAYLG